MCRFIGEPDGICDSGDRRVLRQAAKCPRFQNHALGRPLFISADTNNLKVLERFISGLDKLGRIHTGE